MRLTKGIGFGKRLTCLCVALSILASVGFGFEVNKCKDKLMYAFFGDKFKEPIEVIYFLMNDKMLYTVTSNYENKVSLNLYLLQKT